MAPSIPDFNTLSLGSLPRQQQRQSPPVSRARASKACDECKRRKVKCVHARDSESPGRNDSGVGAGAKQRAQNVVKYYESMIWAVLQGSQAALEDPRQPVDDEEFRDEHINERIKRLEAFCKTLLVAIYQGSEAARKEFLRPQESVEQEKTIEQLLDLYFKKIHPQMPMIHSARFFKSLNSPFVNERPPRCLRYIMCALAASTDSNNARESKAFYKQAKECLDDDKAKEEYDRGSINTLSHVQTIVLIAIYEHRHRFRSGPNMRLSEALALSNNLGLHKGPGPNFVEYGIANHSDDFGEVGERRRTFWVCFIEFVYTSCDEESLSPIREDDVTSHLPVSDEDFENGEQVETMPLQYALTVQGAEKLTPFAGACAMTCLLRRIMTHNAKGKRGHDPWNVSFKRYNELFQTLQAVKAGLPDEFKLCGSFDPRNLFVGVLFHAARIELHWVAMEKADGRDDRKAVHNHKLECVTAAADMSKMFTHSDQMDMS
ncbi:fungal-specific transcription factor domain-containing protein [Phyllosticta capitalensis]|uniref:Fungal-specific transcription factor domain-containing protein n=1 Tax=Phyllosticta capitalensis TaxID=121624 RepID=A0ABR1YV14_9PEZI